MSDTPVEPGPPEAAPEGTGAPEAPAPEPTYLDADQYSGHHVRIKVDGQELSVPLSEALGGYQRQADYTRKTQELADLKKQAEFGLTLQQALEANPIETLGILQRQYQQAQAEEPVQPEDEWETEDDKRWKDVNSRLQRYEQQQADNELRQAIGVLQSRYGDDFDPKEVVQAAFRQQRMDLENVYKELAFDRYRQGLAAANQQQSQEEAARVAAKTQTGNIHSGNGAANTAAPSTGSLSTIEEAWEEAKRQLGVV
jgi:hypothetical protein